MDIRAEFHCTSWKSSSTSLHLPRQRLGSRSLNVACLSGKNNNSNYRTNGTSCCATNRIRGLYASHCRGLCSEPLLRREFQGQSNRSLCLVHHISRLLGLSGTGCGTFLTSQRPVAPSAITHRSTSSPSNFVHVVFPPLALEVCLALFCSPESSNSFARARSFF